MNYNIEQYKTKLILRNLSPKTINSYVSNVKRCCEKLGKDPNDINESDLICLIVDNTRVKSGSYQNMIINSFKSYFSLMRDREFDYKIFPRPKNKITQPDILSTDEVQSIIDVTMNMKHKTIIALMYSCALRVSEVINMRLKDIDSKNQMINVRQAKGGVDRVVPLDSSILHLLRRYWENYRMTEFLFEGAKGGRYSSTSVQNIIKKAAKKAGINKKISTHSLRHSSITQMVKNGVDLRSIQKIAGHKNINTTANYIRLSDKDILSVESPIKLINLKP